MKLKITAGALAFLLATLLPGCGATHTGQQPGSLGTAHSIRSGVYSWNNPEGKKHTKADYELALSFKTQGYENLTVEAFARNVMNPENETAYHKTEEALERLAHSLPNDDPNAGFIFGDLFATWGECEKQHYNKCSQAQAPWHSGQAQYETYGDVFGDTVTIAGAYLDFDFNYTIDDPKTFTVAQRQQQFQSLETDMEAFLKEQPAKTLVKQDAMKKTLETQLKRRLKALNSGLSWAGECGLSYYWNGPEEEEPSGQELVVEGTASASSEKFPQHYTKAQYNLVLEKLRYADYKQLSVAAFARLVNQALQNYDNGNEAFIRAYELVISNLEETDPASDFLRNTVELSQEEYRCREKEVYWGKPCDPNVHQSISHQVMEDVFGDKVAVGGIEADYTLAYRIVNADNLTVEGRDSFFEAVRQGVVEFLNEAASTELTERQFEAGIEATGKAASNPDIQFVGCQVGYYYLYL